VSAGFGPGAVGRTQRGRRSGLPVELMQLEAEAAITPKQRCLQVWTEAGVRSPVFRELMVMGLRVEQRVTEVLERSGPIGEDHGALLRLMALSLTSGLLDEAGMTECHRVCPMQEWLDVVPRRVAWSVAVGGGKTLTAASLCRGVADLIAVDPGLDGPVTRGVLYSCRTHKLIEGMLQALELMGVPRELVGVFHGTSDKEVSVPSIRADAIDRFPILLTTQAQLQNASARHDVPQEAGSDDGVTLEDLLVYLGKDRLAIWDEAFQSSLADSASAHLLSLGLGGLKQAVENLASDKVLELVKTTDRKRTDSDVLTKPNGEALVQLLDGIVQAAVKPRGADPVKPIRLPVVTELQIEQLKKVARWFRSSKSTGPAEAIDAVASMTAAGALDVSLMSGQQGGNTIVRPRVVISDRLRRLVVLDAGYTTSVIAQMDPTVQLASGATYASRELVPKLFHSVSVHCYPDHSGRGDAINGEGLGNTRIRMRLIRDQVDRISRVPLGELSLVVTFSKRDGDAVNFKAEVEAELDATCHGWRDVVNGHQRVTVIGWGEHVGANDWRDFKHLFFVGVLATSRQDESVWREVSPYQVEVNQAAQEIMQAIGRGHARKTINGQAGQMTIHLPWKEGAGRFHGMAPSEGSPLWQELKQMMPGCVITTTCKPRKLSGAELVEQAAILALGDVAADQITTKELKPLLVSRLPGGACSDRVLGQGLKQLAEVNAKKAAAGESCWIKPTPTSRRWIRFQGS
jgi:hypothetical protein